MTSPSSLKAPTAAMAEVAGQWHAMGDTLTPEQIDELANALATGPWPSQQGLSELLSALRNLQAGRSQNARVNGEALARSTQAYQRQEHENSIQLVDNTTCTAEDKQHEMEKDLPRKIVVGAIIGGVTGGLTTVGPGAIPGMLDGAGAGALWGALTTPGSGQGQCPKTRWPKSPSFGRSSIG